MRDEDIKWWQILLSEQTAPIILPKRLENELAEIMVRVARSGNDEFPEFTDDLDFFDHAEVIG